MPTLKQLDNFITVAGSGSFSKAAEKLFVTSTALILQMNHLEDELGFKLFSRSTQGIKLTEAGAYFLQETKDIQTKLDMAVTTGRRLANRQSEIKVGYVNWSLPQVVLELSAKVNRQNDVTMALVFTDMRLALDHVLTGLLDCCILPMSSRVRNSGLKYLPVRSIPLYVGTMTDFPTESVTLEDLAGLTMVLPEAGLFDSTDAIRDYIMKHQLPIRIVPISDNMEAEVYCAENEACRINASFQMESPLKHYLLTNDIPYMFCIVFRAEREQALIPLLQNMDEPGGAADSSRS